MAYNLFENWNGRIFIKKENKQQTQIDVVGNSPIKVTTEQRGDITTKIVRYAPFILQTVKLVAEPNLLEVGNSASVLFKGTVLAGSELIKEVYSNPVRTMTFDGINAQFTVDIGSNTKGTHGIHSLIATDTLNNEVFASTGVLFNHRYHRGTVARNTTNFVSSESILGTSVTNAFSGFKDYVIPAGQHHLAWLVPVGEGSSFPTPKGLNGFPWEITTMGQTSLVNSFGLSVTYDIVRTSNYYTGENTVQLTLN